MPAVAIETSQFDGRLYARAGEQVDAALAQVRRNVLAEAIAASLFPGWTWQTTDEFFGRKLDVPLDLLTAPNGRGGTAGVYFSDGALELLGELFNQRGGPRLGQGDEMMSRGNEQAQMQPIIDLINGRFDELGKRMDAMGSRVDRLEGKIDKLPTIEAVANLFETKRIEGRRFRALLWATIGTGLLVGLATLGLVVVELLKH